MDLVLEVTRKCNLACARCLRGDAQNKMMSKKVIDEILNKIHESISIVTFSGGEPTLNLKIINYFIDQCKVRNISFSGFFIATNGVNNNNPEFLTTLAKLYAHADEKELCAVRISNDDFHQNEQGEAELGLLSCLNFVHSEGGREHDRGWIMQGRYEDNYGQGRDISTMDDNETIYVNVNGEIFNNCNLSYKEQKDRMSRCKISVFDPDISSVLNVFDPENYNEEEAERESQTY